MNISDEELSQIRESWLGGQPREAGRLVLEKLPPELHPRWAAGILRLVIGRSAIHSALIEEVLSTAEHQERWKNGHRIFDNLRDALLELDELGRGHEATDEQLLLSSVLSLAELVAKVMYNATHPNDPFDDNSGVRVAAFLRYFVDRRWTDEMFAHEAWSVLCPTQYKDAP